MERPKKNPQRVRTRYTKEFKLEAVRLLKIGQKPPTDLASSWASAATNSINGPTNWIDRAEMKQ